MIARGSRSARNAETRKKKKAHKIPRAKVGRIQGNSQGVRNRLRKEAARNLNDSYKEAAAD